MSPRPAPRTERLARHAWAWPARLAVESLGSIVDFAPRERVTVPELGAHVRFERPVLKATLRMKHGQLLHVLVVHLKSKRPKYLQDEVGNALEDRDDPGGHCARRTARRW